MQGGGGWGRGGGDGGREQRRWRRKGAWAMLLVPRGIPRGKAGGPCLDTMIIQNSDETNSPLGAFRGPTQ